MSPQISDIPDQILEQDPSGHQYSNTLIGIAIDGIPIYTANINGDDIVARGLISGEFDGRL